MTGAATSSRSSGGGSGSGFGVGVGGEQRARSIRTCLALHRVDICLVGPPRAACIREANRAAVTAALALRFPGQQLGQFMPRVFKAPCLPIACRWTKTKKWSSGACRSIGSGATSKASGANSGSGCCARSEGFRRRLIVRAKPGAGSGSKRKL